MTNDLILPSECAAPPASFVVAAVSNDDDCTICLEPFSCRDPRTVAECTHGYHLQCILEWSQRSEECPICCRQLVLKDSASQELLAAVEFEGNATSRHIEHRIPEVYEANNLVDVGASHIDDSDFQERILHHPSGSGVTNRACSGNSRRRQISSRVGQGSFPVGASSDMHQVTQRPVDEFGNGLPASGISSTSSSGVSSVANVASGAAVYKGGSVGLGKPSPENPQKQSPPEFLHLPGSIKSKLFDASPRYNESFSKNTQRFKRKLQANNNSVKELGREVQREMSVSIAGLAKMVERLDLSSNKGGGVSSPLRYTMGREPQTLGRKENLSKRV
ncbi:PREDICTED: E3 ubiquitin-protein ligase RHF1A-like isoform X1 [Ipomoea nil]|uniref:E3 ubiquitin-protein ligase RHF1A-like isoform X1 n=1 Tax=Ipomoea nil TaxID=35883 RepID=UPI000901B704|nr:PREDICTED: E3 ubiquitin-protein ligase RHF1A-like isoform X1 [Ipomoea nil]